MRLVPSAATATLALALLTSTALAQSAADPATLRSIEAQVVQIRGLQPLSEPGLNLLDHESLSTYLTDEFNTNYLPSERETEQKEMVAFGFLQPTDNLVQLELNLLSEQVIGVYDADARALFVVNDQGAFGPGARITYAHEFNHALQDQHYDLNRIAPKHPDSNDHSLAVHALIEGDAILLQTLWAEQHLSRAELLDLATTAGSDAGLDDAPLIVRSELLFPYTDGFNFVGQAYRQAGNSYSAVDAIFANPPESTAQVLHPDLYRQQVHPVTVQMADLASALGADWRPIGSGVLGELDTRVLLEQYGTPSVTAKRVAAGWRGDRWQLLDNPTGSAIVLRSAWDSDAAASDFFGTYTQTLRKRFVDASVEAAADTREALSDGAAATDVRLLGSDVLVVIAPDRAAANAIVEAATSSAP